MPAKRINQQHHKNTQTIYISMPYYNNFSSNLAQSIKRILDLPDKKIMFELKSQIRLCSLFNCTYRDKKISNSRVIYQYNCKNCKNSYIGQTERDVEQRKQEHQSAFKGIETSKIADHCIQNKHQNDWNYKILTVETNDIKRVIKESLLIDKIQETTDRIIYSQKSYELNVFG